MIHILHFKVQNEQLIKMFRRKCRWVSAQVTGQMQQMGEKVRTLVTAKPSIRADTITKVISRDEADEENLRPAVQALHNSETYSHNSNQSPRKGNWD